jgi:hypothetical protein
MRRDSWQTSLISSRPVSPVSTSSGRLRATTASHDQAGLEATPDGVPAIDTTADIDRQHGRSDVARAISKADGAEFESDPARYRRLALAALGPLNQPREGWDAAREAVWFDAFWAINSRTDFKKAVRAMIRAAIET